MRLLRRSIGIVITSTTTVFALTTIPATTPSPSAIALTMTITTSTALLMLLVFDGDGFGVSRMIFDNPIFGGKNRTPVCKMIVAWVFGPAADTDLGIVNDKLLNNIVAHILGRVDGGVSLGRRLWAGVGAASRSGCVGSKVEGILDGLLVENALFDVSK